MPKIEPYSDRSFLIDGTPYLRNSCRVNPVTNDFIVITFAETGTRLYKSPLTEWTDENDASFASLGDFVDYIEPFFFYSLEDGVEQFSTSNNDDVGSANNNTGSNITAPNYTLNIGANIIFYNQNFFNIENYYFLSPYIDSGDITLFDIDGNSLTAKEAKKRFVTIIDLISRYNKSINDYSYNNIIAEKIILRYISKYINDNAITDAIAATQFEFISEVINGLRSGVKSIVTGLISALGINVFYTSLFRTTLQDYINSSYK